MSKSRGNVIPIDVPVDRYGSDTTRLYEMFMGPLEATKPWSMQGVEGISRFLNRAWRMIVDESAEEMRLNPKVASGNAAPNEEQLRVMHKTIQSVTQDMESLRFNTAISRRMEFVNYFTGQDSRPCVCMENFVLLLSPMAPHISEELWHTLGHEESLLNVPWPTHREEALEVEKRLIVLQVNGKVRSRIEVPVSYGKKEMETEALADERIRRFIDGKPVKKVVVVPHKLVNVVV